MGNPEEVDFNFDDEADGLRALPPMRATKLTREASGKTVEDNLNAKINGDWFNIPFPNMPQMSKTLVLVPGAVLGLCGGSKVGKSFLLLEWFWRWIMEGVEVRMLAMESGCDFHAERMVAQMAQMRDFLDPNALKDNPEAAEKARQALADWKPWVDYITPNIQDMSDNPQTVGNVLAWMDRELRGQGPTGKKAQIVIVDPVTAIAPDPGQRFADHYRLVLEADRLARKLNGRVILSTHPIRSKSSYAKEVPSIDRVANGQAYGQFCTGFGWLEYAAAKTKCEQCKGKGTWKDGMAKVSCAVCAGTGKSQEKARSNRSFHWLVIRRAPNPGQIPLNFNGGSLTHTEVGDD